MRMVKLSVLVAGVLFGAVFLFPLPQTAWAQGAVLIDENNVPLIHGIRKKPRKARVCLDYGKTRLGDGTPYRVVEDRKSVV